MTLKFPNNADVIFSKERKAIACSFYNHSICNLLQCYLLIILCHIGLINEMKERKKEFVCSWLTHDNIEKNYIKRKNKNDNTSRNGPKSPFFIFLGFRI